MNQELEQVIAKIEAEAYQKGWADAISSVFAAAQNQGTYKAVPAKKSAGMAQPDAGKSVGGQPGFRSGSTVLLALDLIKKRPGLTTSDIIAHLKNDDPHIVERTIRTALGRLKAKRYAGQNEGRWRALS